MLAYKKCYIAECYNTLGSVIWPGAKVLYNMLVKCDITIGEVLHSILLKCDIARWEVSL